MGTKLSFILIAAAAILPLGCRTLNTSSAPTAATSGIYRFNIIAGGDRAGSSANTHRAAYKLDPNPMGSFR